MISILKSLPAYRFYDINKNKLGNSVTKHLLKTCCSCFSHLYTSMGDRISWVTGGLVILGLPCGLHYCPVLQTVPEKASLRHGPGKHKKPL